MQWLINIFCYAENVDGLCDPFHFGGSVTQQFELVDMRPHVLTFEKPSSFNELIARVKVVMNVGCYLRLHERYDIGATYQFM
jgi:hypothetical protein